MPKVRVARQQPHALTERDFVRRQKAGLSVDHGLEQASLAPGDHG
jgi:hypothetical protein